MKPEFSEFSFGFALTRELVDTRSPGWAIAPVFPSLRAEGSAAGGYDVKLGAGYPIFLQFKRSHYLPTARASQWAKLGRPYYRFSIYSSLRSKQHALLVKLDSLPATALYAAPEFHTQTDLDSAFQLATVQRNTAFFRASAIGVIADTAEHHVCFAKGATSGHFFSDPRMIQRFPSGEDFVAEVVREIGKAESLTPNSFIRLFDERVGHLAPGSQPEAAAGTRIHGLSRVAAFSRVALGAELLWLQRGQPT